MISVTASITPAAAECDPDLACVSVEPQNKKNNSIARDFHISRSPQTMIAVTASSSSASVNDPELAVKCADIQNKYPPPRGRISSLSSASPPLGSSCSEHPHQPTTSHGTGILFPLAGGVRISVSPALRLAQVAACVITSPPAPGLPAIRPLASEFRRSASPTLLRAPAAASFHSSSPPPSVRDFCCPPHRRLREGAPTKRHQPPP